MKLPRPLLASITVAATLMGSTVSLCAQTGHRLSLEEAASIALRSNHEMRLALANLERARGGLAEVRSALLPQIGLSAQGIQYDAPNKIDFGKLMGGPSLPLTLAERWNPALTAALSMQIDISGAVKCATNQAEFNALAARIDVDRVRNELRLRVRENYFGVQRAKGRFRVAIAQLESAKTRLNDASLNEKVGNAPKFDVVSAQRDEAQAQANAISAKTSEEIAMASLINLIGADQGMTYDLDDESQQDASPLAGNPNTWIEEATRQRPEVLESNALLQAAKLGVQLSRRTELPGLALGIGAQYLPNSGLFTPAHSTSASLTLSIPLFDGGVSRARRIQAGAEVAAREEDLRQALAQIALDIKTSNLLYQDAVARLKFTEAEVFQASEAFRLAKERYAVGVSQSSVVSPQLELSTAHAALSSAENDRVDAQMDVQLARARFDRALGRFGTKG